MQLSLYLNRYINNYSGLTKSGLSGVLLTLIENAASGICFFLTLYFVNELKISIGLASSLISIYGIGTAVGGFVGGKLSDRFLPVRVALFSVLIESICFAMLVNFHSLIFLIILMFFFGLGTYAFKAANNIWMLQDCKDSDTRLRTINLARVLSNLGVFLTGSFIGFLPGYFEQMFYVGSLLLLGCAIFLSFQTSAKHGTLAKNANEPMDLLPEKTNFKIVYLMILVMFLVGLNIAQLSSTYPLYISQSFPDLGIKAVSILFIIDTLMIVAVQAPLVNYFKNYPNKILIIGIGSLFMSISMIILSAAKYFSVAVFAGVLWTIGEMLIISLLNLVCYENAGNHKGKYTGMLQGIYAVSVVLGAVIGGHLYQFLGGQFVLCVMACISFISFIFCYAFKCAD